MEWRGGCSAAGRVPPSTSRADAPSQCHPRRASHVRGPRVGGVPRLWRARERLLARPLHRMRRRAPCRVLLQASRCLSLVLRPTRQRRRRPSRRPRTSPRAVPTVDAVTPHPASLGPGAKRRALHRGPLSLERLSLRDHGKLAWRMKRPAPDGSTHLLLSPLQLVRKLAALVPPPRFNLTRFHGVFAPNSKLRARVVPTPPPAAPPAQSPAPASTQSAPPSRPTRRVCRNQRLLLSLQRLRRQERRPLPGDVPLHSEVRRVRILPGGWHLECRLLRQRSAGPVHLAARRLGRLPVEKCLEQIPGAVWTCSARRSGL